MVFYGEEEARAGWYDGSWTYRKAVTVQSSKVETTETSFPENGVADINIAFQLGRIYYNSGNINEAKNIFLEIERLQPSNSNARYSLGLIYEKEENSEEALREFETVLLLNPDNQEVIEKIDNLKKLIEKKNKKSEPTLEPVIEEEDGEDEVEEEDVEE